MLTKTVELQGSDWGSASPWACQPEVVLNFSNLMSMPEGVQAAGVDFDNSYRKGELFS